MLHGHFGGQPNKNAINVRSREVTVFTKEERLGREMWVKSSLKQIKYSTGSFELLQGPAS